MQLYVKSDREWLYPDEAELGSAVYVGEALPLYTAAGSPSGIQLLAADVEGAVLVTDLTGGPVTEINLLRDVQVNYNTAEEMQGFGKNPFVYMERRAEVPKHCTRLAPFRVYDPYKPYEGELPQDGKIAFYLCFAVGFDTPAGVYRKRLAIRAGGQEQQVTVDLHVYDAGLSREPRLNVTNWFSVDEMATRHGLELFSPAHFAMIEQYADAMLRMRQTHFLLPPETVGIIKKDGEIHFDFSLLEKLAELFFRKGFKGMEFGPVGMRKKVYHEELHVLQLENIPVDSDTGRQLLHRFFSGLAEMADCHNWKDKILFHIADEPDEPESAVPRRLVQYRMIVEIMHRYFPEALVCEAVKTTKFEEFIDILVPLSKTYEEFSQEFDQVKQGSNQVWFYICCVPTGDYFQRFLDVPLLGTRYVFWAGAKYGLTGYLHWGLNRLEPDQDPFEQTNQYHAYGDSVCLPAGDSHIFYADRSGLYLSMRAEACRKGAEDADLLMCLREKDLGLYQELIGKVPGFHGKVNDGEFMENYLRLLQKLSDK